MDGSLVPEVPLDEAEVEGLIEALDVAPGEPHDGLDYAGRAAVQVRAGHLYDRKGYATFSELGSNHHLHYSNNDLVYISVEHRYVLEQDSPAAQLLLGRARTELQKKLDAELHEAEIAAANAQHRLQELRSRTAGDQAR